MMPRSWLLDPWRQHSSLLVLEHAGVLDGQTDRLGRGRRMIEQFHDRGHREA